MNYAHFISFVKQGDTLNDGTDQYEVVKPEFYSCGTSRIILKNLSTGVEFQLTEFDERCSEFIHSPIPGEFDS